MKTHSLLLFVLLAVGGATAVWAGTIEKDWEDSGIWKFVPNGFDSNRASAEGSADLMNEKSGVELVMKYDFSQGGEIAGAVGALKVDGPVANLLFSLKSDQPLPRLLVRYQDSTNQTHERTVKYAWAGDWEDIRVPLFDSGNQPHWGGANDGAIHWPIKSIQFFVSKEGLGKAVGEISIKGIDAE